MTPKTNRLITWIPDAAQRLDFIGYHESGRSSAFLRCERGPIMLLVLYHNPAFAMVYDQLTKEVNMKDSIGGPFLQAAFFCEKVLQEKDGVLSAIRIVDRFTHSTSAEGAPDIMPQFNIGVSILIGFKSGDVKGKWELKVKPIAPSGQELPGFVGPVLFEGDERGAAIVIQYGLVAKEEGIYWFDVILNDKLITKMPLRIIYEKTQVTSTSVQPVH